jgi:hypothetical protein
MLLRSITRTTSMQPRRVALALVSLPLLLAAAPLLAELDFQPPQDSKVTRDYSIAFDIELGDLTVIADGQDMSEMVPAEFEGSGEFKMQTQDHFVRAGGGRALELIRTFASFEGSFEAGGESEEMDDAGELEGKSVRFVWNEEAGDYDVAFHECEGEEATLEAIGADMDLSALLPGRAVEVGDVWTVEASKLGSVLLFGHELEGPEDDAVGQALVSELKPQLEKLLEGFKIACEYKGEREEAGAKLGVIGVDLVGEGELDLEPVIRAAMDSQEMPIEIDLSFDTASLGVSFSGKGELLWNLERGLLHAFDLGSDIELAVDLDVGVDAQGESHEMQAEVELLGRGTWKVRTPTGE